MSSFDKFILILCAVNTGLSVGVANHEATLGWLAAAIYFTLYAIEKGEKK